MARTMLVLALLLATLTLGGCLMPNGSGSGYGYGNGSSGYGYGGSCPTDTGYAGGYAQAPAPYYGQQAYAAQQPYINNYNGAGYPPSPWQDPTASPGIDQREREQAMRIRQGLRDGSLTPQEAQRLWAEQRHIRAAEARMKADGNLSPQERARLNQMLNHSNRDIYSARHNGVVAPGNGGAAIQPNGQVIHPNGGPQVHPNGPMVHPNGGPQVHPNGPMVRPNGPMIQPNGGPRVQANGPMVRPNGPMMQGGPRVQPTAPRMAPAPRQQPRRVANRPGV